MKFIEIFVLVSLSSCNLMPYVIQEAEELIEFAVEENQHEIELREKKAEFKPL